MKVLSVRPPWSTLIVAGIKPVENRSWSSLYRGKLLIHSSQKWDYSGAEWICEKFPYLRGFIAHSRHLKGYIIGSVEMIACVKSYPSEWFFGPYGLIFRNPIEFDREKAIPLKGQLGIFEQELGQMEKEICFQKTIEVKPC
jgi:hypothetical protein